MGLVFGVTPFSLSHSHIVPQRRWVQQLLLRELPPPVFPSNIRALPHFGDDRTLFPLRGQLLRGPTSSHLRLCRPARHSLLPLCAPARFGHDRANPRLPATTKLILTPPALLVGCLRAVASVLDRRVCETFLSERRGWKPREQGVIRVIIERYTFCSINYVPLRLPPSFGVERLALHLSISPQRAPIYE